VQYDRETIKKKGLVKTKSQEHDGHDLEIRKDLLMCIEQVVKKVEAEIKCRYIIKEIMEASQGAFRIGIGIGGTHFWMGWCLEPINSRINKIAHQSNTDDPYYDMPVLETLFKPHTL
jgi:hypothetical protein